jgi:hypothetical protein
MRTAAATAPSVWTSTASATPTPNTAFPAGRTVSMLGQAHSLLGLRIVDGVVGPGNGGGAARHLDGRAPWRIPR